MDEVCYISNKHQPLNNLAKRQYFYTIEFISLLHFEKKLEHSIAKVFRNIHFLPLFRYSQKWKRFAPFQINGDFLIIQETKYFYTRHLPFSFYFEKKIALSISESFRNIHFLLHFHYSWQWIRSAIFKINTNLLII